MCGRGLLAEPLSAYDKEVLLRHVSNLLVETLVEKESYGNMQKVLQELKQNKTKQIYIFYSLMLSLEHLQDDETHSLFIYFIYTL